MIVFSNVTKEFDDRTVLDNVSFRIEPGEFVCITGPSGAGKSTILHLLIRAEVATTGTVEVDGANLAEIPSSILQIYRRRTGVLFQDFKLLHDRTVFENVAFAMEACDEPDEVIGPRVTEVLASLGLTGREDMFPRELSGGEKTRVALARAIVNKPSILIADEPTGNIDPDQSIDILRLLREIHAQGTTVILATHDKLVVDALGVRVIRLEAGKRVRDSVGAYSAPKEVVETTGLRAAVPLPTAPLPVAEETPAEVASPEPSAPADGVPPPGRHVPKPSTRGHHGGHGKSREQKHQEKKDDEGPSFGRGHVKPVEVQ